jgi:hypothetical protein
MMAHELLRKAALILADGWCKGGDASDDAGRILPLWSGAARAEILSGPNPVSSALNANACCGGSRSLEPDYQRGPTPTPTPTGPIPTPTLGP